MRVLIIGGIRLISAPVPQLLYLDRIKQGKPIVVHGDGQSLWAAAHANDVALAFVAACGNPQSFGRSYNVTSDERLTWTDMHRIVAEVVDAPRRISSTFPAIFWRALRRTAPGFVRSTLCTTTSLTTRRPTGIWVLPSRFLITSLHSAS